HFEAGMTVVSCIFKKAIQSLTNDDPEKFREKNQRAAEFYICCVWNQCTRITPFPCQAIDFPIPPGIEAFIAYFYPLPRPALCKKFDEECKEMIADLGTPFNFK